MKTFDTISDARVAIMDYRPDQLEALNELVRNQLRTQMASPSPVDQIVGVMEILYSHRDEIDDAGRELVGGLAAFAAMNGWHGLANVRGGAIVQAMRRDIGEDPIPGFSYPEKADDPAASPAYPIPQPEVVPAPPPETPVDG